MADVAADFEAGPDKPSSYMGKVASLLYNRYVNGAKPIAMVSTDNCSHNGDKLYAAIDEFAKAWSKMAWQKQALRIMLIQIRCRLHGA